MRLPAHTHALALLVWCCLAVGCSTPPNRTTTPDQSILSRTPSASRTDLIPSGTTGASIRPVAFVDEDAESESESKRRTSAGVEVDPSERSDDDQAAVPSPAEHSDLRELETAAARQNPQLVRLLNEYRAAAARSQHVNQLPDPKLGVNVFGDPLETASGSQRANMNLSQVIPWLEKLDARRQQACFEAFAIRAEYEAARLKVIAGIRVGWYRLYVLGKQIDTSVANQELLESLIQVANSRFATGQASQGDVLLGTLELSNLQERLLTYRRQRRAVQAEINRLIGRSADAPIPSPEVAPGTMIDLDAAAIHSLALASQPEIKAAGLRTQATRWGIEVSRLSRRPDFTVSANYFFTDDNRPTPSVVNVGEDPWSVGVQLSLPIWRKKYDAIEREAGWKHQAAHATIEEVADKYDALILDLVAEAERAVETAELYESTILPQARQTLAADQQSYAGGSVEFDRVIRDYRNLLTLELGFHQAIGELAIANARLQQAAGRDLKATRRIGVQIEMD